MDECATAFTELVLEVFRLNGGLLEAGDRLTRPVGLSSARWQVLGVVEHGPSPVAHIARTMGLTRQGVQGIADILTRDGYAEYAENPHHRRAKLLKLTPKGEQALIFVRERHAEWAAAIGRTQTLEGLQDALTVMRELRLVLEQNVPVTEETV
jgi:DNA-binding MarR family transcriptional regulator